MWNSQPSLNTFSNTHSLITHKQTILTLTVTLSFQVNKQSMQQIQLIVEQSSMGLVEHHTSTNAMADQVLTPISPFTHSISFSLVFTHTIFLDIQEVTNTHRLPFTHTLFPVLTHTIFLVLTLYLSVLPSPHLSFSLHHHDHITIVNHVWLASCPNGCRTCSPCSVETCRP